MNIIILGAGLSGISLAYFMQNSDQVNSITILEKDDSTGGLCRSIQYKGYTYDIGPHILFSQDKEMLNLMLSVLDERNDLMRSNQIIYKDRWIQYPFENDLSKLPEAELNYCITAFNNNPYESYNAENMLQFFLRTFGEGITNTYLRPYNEKIWKYDPSFMNTSMVDRIPKPTDEEIRRSASGETIDGYLHQLYFSYPSYGGIEAVVRGFEKRLGNKCRIYLNCPVSHVEKNDKHYSVTAGGTVYTGDLVVSTIPIHDLVRSVDGTENIQSNVNDLRYNSIMIFFVKTKKDLCGDNFAFMVPDKDIIFHRISKMDFLGKAYKSEGATYMVEVTYRENDRYDHMTDYELIDAVKQGVCDIHFAESMGDVEVVNLTRHKYAYVIYDLNHKNNMTQIRSFFDQHGIILNGRFGNFEYWNMDRIIRESKNVSEKILGQFA